MRTLSHYCKTAASGSSPSKNLDISALNCNPAEREILQIPSLRAVEEAAPHRDFMVLQGDASSIRWAKFNKYLPTCLCPSLFHLFLFIFFHSFSSLYIRTRLQLKKLPHKQYATLRVIWSSDFETNRKSSICGRKDVFPLMTRIGLTAVFLYPFW